ncbi:dTDP-4-dehydrorhamnose reductase [Sulfurirhabdus autotrophica]|uniref:dTDP-4-dehydrorhamnose reductase n=1 Tax=Sulfurirhabdus autotrophica TaxID=1706046 RepID=A0A4R3XX40_9PROT|nr:dTDP-4-dehydrorhamnose reductase [Sulfurirhabdus autotrophica]TCV83431.1 dTDP-4-dehydrorhamnose reductase [Sulfurirhabdus autotrophica]
MKRILLIGKNGQVGWELARTLAPLGEIIIVDRQVVDLAKPDSIVSTVREIKPNIIVNAAAYTAVDKAESEPDLAEAINSIAPGILAEEARRINALLIHYSTDYVFDGTKDEPYTELDIPNPLSVYGKTKLVGEQAIQAANVPHIILRTSWVYGGRGNNFLRTILRLAQERDELKIVDDQIGAPTWSRMIAEATAQILGQVMRLNKSEISAINELSGIYHLTSRGGTSWHGFAQSILDIMSTPIPRLVPISTSEYPLPAHRPQNSVLLNEKLERVFGLILPEWKAALELCLDETRPQA